MKNIFKTFFQSIELIIFIILYKILKLLSFNKTSNLGGFLISTFGPFTKYSNIISKNLENLDYEKSLVSSISKKLLGKVCEIRNFGSNDILIIRTNDHDHEVLIPFVIDKIIHKIDKDNLIIYAEWETEY